MIRLIGILVMAFVFAYTPVSIFEKAGLISVATAEEHAAEGEGAVEDGPVFLEMKPLSVPIRKKSGAIRYYMFLSMSMEFDEQDKKNYARKMLPRLRDAFLQDLSGRSVLFKDKSRGIDFEQVKRRLLKQAKKVLEKKAPTTLFVVKVYKGN